MKSLSHEKAAFLGVVAARIVPEIADLDTSGTSRMFSIIDDALHERPPAVRRQFALFLGVLRWSPLVRFGAPFEKLETRSQDAVLRWFEDAPLRLLRAGLWGLKTMVFMGYYGQTEIGTVIGYDPSLEGRNGLHA